MPRALDPPRNASNQRFFPLMPGLAATTASPN
jgi:hypothetical protein